MNRNIDFCEFKEVYTVPRVKRNSWIWHFHLNLEDYKWYLLANKHSLKPLVQNKETYFHITEYWNK